ncbi:MAG: protein-L-isoaspartate(D-aspartate) O-methyltransferase [Actinobacteria bacterium]|nr:protein-L-isoaspartate(D-aspartate) O-methyltransferase [Actinomycetota bacterium]
MMKERIDFKSLRKKNGDRTDHCQRDLYKKVLEAFGKVPRENFVGEDSYPYAYDDRPLPIGYGQTISQPYIVALMTESLELEGDETILEIGTGSGYQTAMLAEIVKKVYSIEIVIPLYERAKKILSGYKNISLASKDGYYGWEEHSPFDRIIVTAAPEEVPPPLIDQLKDDGIMIVPSGPAGWNQVLLKIIKKNGKLSKIKISDVAFVPLTRRPD